MRVLETIRACIKPRDGTVGTRTNARDFKRIDNLSLFHRDIPVPSSADRRPAVGLVYVIGSDGGEIKIGRTTDLSSRLRSIQSGSPRPLSVLHARACLRSNCVEKIAHLALRDKRTHGEWFDVGVEEAIATVEEAAAMVEADDLEDYKTDKPQLIDARERFLKSDTAWEFGRRPEPVVRRPAPSPATSHRHEQARPIILEFLRDAVPAGEPMGFKQIKICYDRWHVARGWPPMSEKSLATCLVSVGCIKTVIDGRSKGRGRYAAYELPMEMAA